MHVYKSSLARLVAFAERQSTTRLGDEDVELLVGFRRERLMAVSACTVLLESETIKQLMNHYVMLGKLRENPLCRLKLRKPRPIPQPVLTPSQVEKIAATARPEWGEVFRFLAATGLRSSELVWLE